MGGATATERWREAGFEKPIHALTAKAMKGFERKCLDAGGTGFRTKPSDIDGLIETLAKLLGVLKVRGQRKPSLTPIDAGKTMRAAHEPCIRLYGGVFCSVPSVVGRTRRSSGPTISIGCFLQMRSFNRLGNRYREGLKAARSGHYFDLQLRTIYGPARTER